MQFDSYVPSQARPSFSSPRASLDEATGHMSSFFYNNNVSTIQHFIVQNQYSKRRIIAMNDPVAEKSAFLRMYMSNHPDTLVAYAKWFGKVKEPVKNAEMSAIDCKSMTLICTLNDSTKKTVRVPLEPPLRGYEDVKPRLLEMKAFAQEGLGMIKVPKITTFDIPIQAYFMFLYTTFQTYLYVFGGTPLPYARLANLLISLFGTTPISILFWTVVILHILESLYTIRLCRSHSTGFTVGLQYVAATLLCGFPIWIDLRRKIQRARIDSVMKIQ